MKSERSSMCAARAALLVVFAGTLCGVVWGQSPVVGGSDTGWVLAPAGGQVPDPYQFVVRSGTATEAGNNPAESHSTQSQATLARMGIKGSVTHDGQGDTDEFRYALAYQRDFSISESATVNLSNMLSGLFSFSGGGGANNIPGFVTAEVTVLRRNAQGQYVPTGIVSTINVDGSATGLPGQTGDISINDRLNLTSGDLDVAQGAQYRVVARLLIGGTGLVNTAAGSAVTVDTRTGARAGQAASIAVLPRGYNGDSRAAVGAAGAAAYGVSGQGIRVGVIEANAYAHESLGNRLVTRNGNVDPDRQLSSEHTLAVAGIIGSRSNTAQARGIAPDATVYTAAPETWADGFSLFADFRDQGIRVVNMSFSFPPNANAGDYSAARMNQWITGNPMMTFVASAGNDGTPAANTSNIRSPGSADNLLCVGAVNRDFTARADFSSYSRGGVGRRPDIVAPGEYILAPGARDADNNGLVDEFRRSFVGTDFDNALGSASTGAISGTSFAAPFVTGTVALLQDYQRTHVAGHDAESIDSRVMRAIVMNTATQNVTRSNGGAWAQNTTVYQMPGHPELTTLGVNISCDEQLGAGLLSVRRSLEMFQRNEVRAADNATEQHVRIDVTGGVAEPNVPMFWDRQEVRGASEADGFGTVEYTLGQMSAGWHFRSTLAWIVDTQNINDQIQVQYSNLQLLLYRDAGGDGNAAGYDPANPDADLLVTGTVQNGGAVRMLDISLATTGNYYLVVMNQSPRPQVGDIPMFGLSVYIPGPSAVSVLALAGLASLRRRRA